MQTITPFLWFNDNVEEVAKFYASIFKDSEIISSSPTGVTFRLNGREFIAFNGGPTFRFNEAISLFVSCETQAEVDELWEKLSKGGETKQCGWLQDRYGLFWQIIPKTLMELMTDPDSEKAKRVRDAMLKMTKIDIDGLKRAYASS